MSSIKTNLSFVDTNIWLYAFIKSQDANKTTIAQTVIQSNDIIISSQVINEICVNLIKKANFDEESIRNLVEDFYNNYRVASINREALLKASRLRESYNFSYWDSIITACALIEGADILYSEDMHAGLIIENKLQILNPF